MSQIRIGKHFVLSSIAILLWLLFTPLVSFAQSLPCGNITAPQYFFGVGIDEQLATEAIEDCSNPFSLTVDPVSPYTLIINGQPVPNNGSAAVVGGRTKDVIVSGSSNLDGTNYFLFKHEGNDYVYTSLTAPETTRAEFETYASTFFPTNQEAQTYLMILDEMLETGDVDQFFYDENGEDIFDPDTGESVESRFYSFYYSALDYYEVENIPYVEAGTYTMVMKEYELILTQRTFFDNIFDFFIKTAHAQYVPLSHTYAITFTIAELEEEPEGASSVLFLPGIQASRLYADGVVGTENRLWEPNRNADVEQLAMAISGGSINEVYTRDVIDEVYGSNIYKGFLGVLEELVEDEVIKDFEPFAYDWRYSVQDVVFIGTRYENELRNIVTTLEALAEDSNTGKVTVIGHSNGGLVGKVLLNELERQDKSHLVDKIVFIGTPHLGTPKAIGTVLHGYDQQKLGGAIIDDSTARAVIQNMPGAYSLLPSKRYLELVGEPVVTIAEGTSTDALRNTFGDSIEGVSEYIDFLNGTEGRTNNFSDISNPYKTNAVMLQEALDLHEVLDDWEAPEDVEVFNLVGVGLPTINSIEYRNVTERINCTGTIFGQVVCDDPVNILRPYAHFTQYGDETVASLSAGFVEGETYYFDFKEYDENTVSLLKPSHADFTEINEVQDFVTSFISLGSELSSISYISTNNSEYDSEYEITAIDSPVRILKEDSSGNKTGVIIRNGVTEIVKEIPGSEYIEFAGTKYVIVPKESEITTYLYGEAYGSYTLTTATLTGDEQIIDTELINATTTPTMIAQYEFVNGEYSTILTDYDGDGSVDVEMTLEGEIIQEPEITFEFLRNQITDLKISRVRTTPLLLLVRLAEEAKKLKINPQISDRISDGLLIQLRDTIKQYAKKKWITQEQRDNLVNVINTLINI